MAKNKLKNKLRVVFDRNVIPSWNMPGNVVSGDLEKILNSIRIFKNKTDNQELNILEISTKDPDIAEYLIKEGMMPLTGKHDSFRYTGEGKLSDSVLLYINLM